MKWRSGALPEIRHCAWMRDTARQDCKCRLFPERLTGCEPNTCFLMVGIPGEEPGVDRHRLLALAVLLESPREQEVGEAVVHDALGQSGEYRKTVRVPSDALQQRRGP